MSASATAKMVVQCLRRAEEDSEWEAMIFDVKQLGGLAEDYLLIEKQLDEETERARSLANRATRLTRLIRSAIPEGDQIGVGLDGMISSLLARMVRLEITLDARERTEEEVET